MAVAAAYYDIGTAGEMHHNPAKNVLFVAAQLPRWPGLAAPRLRSRALDSGRAKLRAARERAPHPSSTGPGTPTGTR